MENFEQFTQTWRGFGITNSVGLAVSGGPDSLALMLAFHEHFPNTFQVVTVDHGLRKESRDESLYVGELCRERNITHTIIDLNMLGGSGVQERARNERYRVMTDWVRDNNLAALITAHHADDQAETMVMRLNRGTGLNGVAGMCMKTTTPVSNPVPLIRPFLNITRNEIEQYVDHHGIVAVNDPSNDSDHYERVRVRKALRGSVFSSRGFARAAHHLQEANEAIEWMVEREWQNVNLRDIVTWNPHDLPDMVRLRILKRILQHFDQLPRRDSAIPIWYRDMLIRPARLKNVLADTRKPVWKFKDMSNG